MSADRTLPDERLAKALAGFAAAPRAVESSGSAAVDSQDGIPCFDIAPQRAHDAALRLRDAFGFDVNTFITAVDRFPAEPRFEVLWQFLCVGTDGQGSKGCRASGRVRLRARVPSSDPHVQSIVDVFPGAAYPERECYDMFGVVFDGHPGLKRLLMPDGYGHHPLRKDFPHQGIEPDRLYREWDRKRHARAAAEVLEVPTGAPDVRTPPPASKDGTQGAA